MPECSIGSIDVAEIKHILCNLGERMTDEEVNFFPHTHLIGNSLDIIPFFFFFFSGSISIVAKCASHILSLLHLKTDVASFL